MNQDLVVAGVGVRVDINGRYCLNDIHRASGGASRDQPNHFFALIKTQEYIEYLRSRNPGIANPVEVVKGGRGVQGTFVCKKLVYAYAMWISMEFQDRVIEAYDAITEGRLEEAYWIATRRNTKNTFVDVTDSLKAVRVEAGKPAPAYLFSNEAEMFNRIILGTTAKKFLQERGLGGSEVTRDMLTLDQLRAFEELQKVDAGLIATGDDYETRKSKLQHLFDKRHAIRLVEQFLPAA